MKRITLILSLILSILVPIQAQDYIYMKDADPIKKSLDKLYIKEIDEKYYAELEPDPIAGVYNAYGPSQAQQAQAEWPLTITRDKQSENKIWMHPVIPPFGGLQAHDIQSVYAYYDAIAGTITLPMGQLLYSGNGYNIQLVHYDSTNDFILSTGAVILSVNNVDGNPVLTYPDLLGACDVGIGAWFEIISNITLDRTDATIIESLIPLTEIDSISKVAPELRLLSYEKNLYNQGTFNVLFNYNLLVPNIRPDGKEFLTQGWFNEMISYKAYDRENNIVKEDYIDVFNTSRNNVEIMLQAAIVDSELGYAYYDIDGFLPCDTALQVAFTISPGALVWAGDSTQAFKGVESYVDEQGQGHGIVIDYYNERPRLLSTSPLSFDPTNPRVAYLRFSERMNLDYQEYTISVYRKEANSGKYLLINTTTNYWGMAFSADEIDVQVPDDITLQKGDIVAVSYDNWAVYDKNYSRATPFSTESGIDAEGNPYGLWWMINETDTPYYTASNAESLRHSNKGKQVTVTFNENIVRTDDMPAVTFEVYDSFDNYVCYAQGTASAMASGKNLVITLPDDFEFKAETLSVVLLSFAEGAVEDMYGNKMAAVTNGFDESGLPKALWWSYKGNSGEVTTGEFFAEGEYFFKVAFTEQGEQYEGDLSVEFALQSDSYDLTQLFGQNAPAQTGIEWSVNGLLSSMYNGVTDKAFPAISFKYEYEGNNIEDVFMIDPTTGSTCIGTIDVMGDGTQSNVYIGYVDKQSSVLQLCWYFTLADENQNPNAPVEDLMGWFVGGGAPRILVYGDFGQGEGYYTLMMFDEIYLMRDGALDAANVTVFDKPVKVELAGNPISFSGIKTNFNR